MAAAPITLAAGTLVGGDFIIVEPLVRGGMGAVYVAEQRSTGKRRALKIMHAELAWDATIARRFELEARVGGRIASDHVVEVVAAGVDPATQLPYIVMELLDGEDLRERLRGAPLRAEEIRALFDQLGHAMAAAHAAGVVHRDIKPENVFLARPRRAGRDAFAVKVLDFGIAKLAHEGGIHATRDAIGSPAWMAPEQATASTVSAATYVWALGLLAFEIFTGKLFWLAANAPDGTSTQLLREIAFDPIPPASGRARALGVECARAFDAWFGRCLAREPRDRFPDGGEACRAFLRVLDEENPPASVAPPPRPPPRPPPGIENDTGAASPRALRPPLVPRELRNLSRETPLTSVRPMKPDEATSSQKNEKIAAPPQRASGLDRRSAAAALAIAGAISLASIAFGWKRVPDEPRVGAAAAAPVANDNASATPVAVADAAAIASDASAAAEPAPDASMRAVAADRPPPRAVATDRVPSRAAVPRADVAPVQRTVTFRTESAAPAEPQATASPFEKLAIEALGAAIVPRDARRPARTPKR